MSDTLTGWVSLNAALATARAELSSAAPDPVTDVESESCLARVVTSSLNDNFFRHQLTVNGLTRSVPTMGGPNPDYLLCSAPLDPTRRYRLEGCLHDSERVAVGLYSLGVGGSLLPAGQASFKQAELGTDGRFALDLAADARAHGSLKIQSDARVLLVRTLHRNPDGRPAALTLTGGAAPSGPAFPAETSESGLEQAAQRTLRTVRQYIEWARLISATPNHFALPDPSIAETARGDADTEYFFGYYELREGEWLETLVPGGLTGYWSLHAYSHWLEALPGAGVHDLSAATDPDGRVRVRVGPAVPPDLPNPVDTLGRRRGVLIFRAIGASGLRVPNTVVRSSASAGQE